MSCEVLVVDDDEDIRDTVVEILEDSGYQACGAENGRAALDLLHGSEDPPKLILLDLMMPVMNGFAFREQQLDDPRLRDIPVIVMTAFHDVAQRAPELHGAELVRKPVQLERLLATISELSGPPSRADNSLRLGSRAKP